MALLFPSESDSLLTQVSLLPQLSRNFERNTALFGETGKNSGFSIFMGGTARCPNVVWGDADGAGLRNRALFGETIPSPRIRHGRHSPRKIDSTVFRNPVNRCNSPKALFGETRVVRGDPARYLRRQRPLIQETRKRYFGRRIPLFEETNSTASLV